jgi:DNA repair exonuclease SbcCD ATPase subunit
MSELRRVRDELEDVQQRLEDLDEDDVTTRLDLHEVRAKLREDAERLRHEEAGEESVTELRARLARLEAKRDEILARRVTHEPRGPFGTHESDGGSGSDRIHLPHTDRWLLEDRRLEEEIISLRRHLAEVVSEDETDQPG